MTDTVIFEQTGKVAILTLNQPEKLNAFSDPMLRRLIALIDECQARADIGVVILTGAGRGFCSGGDISTMVADLIAGLKASANISISSARIGRS